MPRKVPTAVAARILGKSENFIRFGLQQGRLPFGSAVKTRKRQMGLPYQPVVAGELFRDAVRADYDHD